ncbi:MAG: hypothetical protein R6V83_08215 [Candidatus Thorarchaeota archaeon]
MWFEIMLIPFIVVMFLFVVFFIVQEGTTWQKHPYLGPFARFIQASAARGFFTFFALTILSIPTLFGVMQGYWLDRFISGNLPSNNVFVVNTLLIMFLILAMMLPVMWGRFRAWRQAVRAKSGVTVRSSA